MATSKFPSSIQLESRGEKRKGNKVVAMSGRPTRHQDWFSGKSIRFMPEGVRLDDFRNNNLLLWRHGSYSPEDILGTATADLEGGQLMSEPNINAPHDRARLVKKLWDMEILKAVSVRLGLNKKDIESVIETENEIIFPSSELQEVSIVPLPADPGAVRQAAFELGLTPERANQILLEVNMENETLDAVEQEGDVNPAVVLELTDEDYVALATELAGNEQAAHILRDALLPHVMQEIETLRNEVARLAGEPVRRQNVQLAFRSNGRQPVDAAPPANIRQPQRNGAGATPKTTAASYHLRKQNR